MATFVLNVFDKNGNVLMDEAFAAENENEAKNIGDKKLKEKGYDTYTNRVTSSTGTLISFHR